MTRLHTALVRSDRDVWVDWEDIPATADWWAEICEGIDSANAFVLLLTTDSLASPTCTLEVAHALACNKRIIIITRAKPDEKAAFAALKTTTMDENLRESLAGRDLLALARENWRQLSRQNWLIFSEDASGFVESFYQFVAVLDTDLEHVREHTRLFRIARDWDNAGRTRDLLLRGSQLAAAETWLAEAGQKEPHPAELHSALIIASRQAENRRQRGLQASLLLALVVAVGVAAFALVQTRVTNDALAAAQISGTEAARQADEAQTARAVSDISLGIAEAARATSDANLREVEAARATSDANLREVEAARATSDANLREVEAARATSDANLREAWSAQARFLADLARQRLESGYLHDALLLALESLRHFPEVYDAASGQALANVLVYPARETANLTHDGVVWGLRISRDGSQLLSWSQDRSAVVWNIADGTRRFSMAHDDELSGAAWNADETRILTWGLDNQVQVWSAADGTLLARLSVEGGIGGVSWHPDGVQVLVWAYDGVARVWNTRTDRLTAQMRHADMRGALWRPDGTQVLTWSGREREVRVWQPSIARAVRLLAHTGAVSGATWSRDGQRILTWSDDRQVRVWNTFGGSVEASISDRDTVLDARWNADETRILTRTTTSARLWDADTGRLQVSLQTDEGVVDGAAWTPDGSSVLTWVNSAAGQGVVYVWNAAATVLTTPRLILPHPDGVLGMVVDAENRHLLTWSSTFDRGMVRTWSLVDGTPKLKLPYDEAVVGAAWDADSLGFSLWTGGLGRGIVYRWDVRPGPAQRSARLPRLPDDLAASVQAVLRDRLGGEFTTLIWPAAGDGQLAGLANGGLVRVYNGVTSFTLPRQNGLRGVAWADDGARLATWANTLAASQLSVWDAASGELLLTIPYPGGAINGARWNRDGTRLLIWSEDGLVTLWDAASGAQIGLLAHSQPVRGALWSADENRLLTWSSASFTGINGQAQVWEVATARPLLTLTHTWVLRGAAWDADETRILTWSYDAFEVEAGDSRLQIWDSRNGNLLRDVYHAGEVQQAWWVSGITPEREVVSLTTDDTLRTWVIDLDMLIALGRAQVVRPFTEAQRRQFFLVADDNQPDTP